MAREVYRFMLSRARARAGVPPPRRLPQILPEADAIAVGIKHFDLAHLVERVRRTAIDRDAGGGDARHVGGEIADAEMKVPNAVRAVRMGLRRTFRETEHEIEAVAIDHREARRIAVDGGIFVAEDADVEIERALQISNEQNRGDARRSHHARAAIETSIAQPAQ